MTEFSATRIPPPLYERSRLLVEAWSEAKAAARYRGLVRFLVSASMARDRRTVFGVLWWVLDPLLLMLVYVVLIDVILDRGGKNYPLFVLIAVIAWKYFTATVGRSMGQLISRERLMRTVAFPRSVLVYAVASTQTIQFTIALGVVFIAAALYGIRPSTALVGLFPVIALQLLVTLGAAFFFSAINVFFRDSQLLVSYLFRLFFYLSPALYPVPHLSPLFARLYKLNPFATLLPEYRRIIVDRQLPNFHALLTVAPEVILVFAVGYLFFVRLEPEFNKVT